MTTNYTQEQLTEISKENFKTVAGQYPKGHCVGYTWFLRVSNHGAAIVTPYQTKGQNGEWSGMNEYQYAL